jgi:aminopeptidase-like protein
MDLKAGYRAVSAPDSIGEEIYALAAELFPICRSITGNGVRETLRRMGRHLALDVQEVPSGAKIFDWTVPREWNIRDAFIRDGSGNKIVDYLKSNLHVVSYSTPMRAHLSLAELKQHLHSLPEQPDLIPYRTTYYAENWGFCISHRQLESLADETYEVVVDSTLEDGSLTYAEHVHRGETDDEVLLSAHVCHPSLANDNCSGLALLTLLARALGRVRTRLSYRFLFAPGTIGAITWLARNEDKANRIKHGLVVSCVGDGGGPFYKKSRRGDAAIDTIMAHVLKHSGLQARVTEFSPYGYDERQFCSPGFNLPVGLFQRSQWGTFPEYHTSGDDLDLIKPYHLQHSFEIVAGAINILENNVTLKNTVSKCEPQLGRRGLYAAIGGRPEAALDSMSMLWLLNLSDGNHSVLDIADHIGQPFSEVRTVAALLEHHGLLVPIGSA